MGGGNALDPLSNFSSSLVVGDWEHVREAWWGCLGLRADGRCSACTCESGRSMESGEGKGMSAEVEIERSRERERERDAQTDTDAQTHRDMLLQMEGINKPLEGDSEGCRGEMPRRYGS